MSGTDKGKLKRQCICLWSVMVGSLCSTPLARAGDETVPSTAPLLVLLAANDEPSVAIERQLVAELRLTLDRVQVEQIAIEQEDFLSLTLPEQLETVQPLLRRFFARAAVWVVTGGRSGYLIQFVVSDRGNATVRTVDAGSPEELALAVRELLDTSYLFNPKPKPSKDEIAATRLYMAMALGLSGGLVGHEGASVAGGSGLQLRLMPFRGIITGLQVAGKLGPSLETGDGLALGWRAEYSVVFGYQFRIGEFGIGPIGELTVTRATLNAVFEKGDFEKYSWWSFRGALGLEVSLRLSNALFVFIDWTFGGIPNPHRFRRESNQSTVLMTPAMDYAFSFGLAAALL